MHRGYTKRWRKRWDKGYHQDLLLWALMDYFIDFANWKDNEFPFLWKGKLVNMVKLKRGQCFFTFKSLAELFEGPKNKVSRKMVRQRIKILEKIGFLEHIQGQQYQIITVLNYDKYNPTDECEGHGEVNKRDIKGTLKGHQKPTPKKDKERIKKEEESPLLFSFTKYEKWRKEINQEMDKSFAKEMQERLRVLAEEGNDPLKVVNQSIKNSWLKLWPVNDKDDDDGSEAAKKRIAKTQQYLDSLKNNPGETPSAEHIGQTIAKLKNQGDIFK